MQQSLQNILQESRHTPHDNHLEEVLFVRIQKKVQYISRVKTLLYGLVGIFSSISLYLYAHSVLSEIANSGAYGYFHLILDEDMSTVFFVIKEMLYAIVESLPIMSMTLSLGLLFILMISIEGVLVSSRTRFMYKPTNN